MAAEAAFQTFRIMPMTDWKKALIAPLKEMKSNGKFKMVQRYLKKDFRKFNRTLNLLDSFEIN